MNRKHFFLCLDAGTTRFKTAAINPTGEVLAASDCTYAPGEETRHEYSTEDFITALHQTVRAIGEKVDLRGITGIGITGHGPSLIPVDRDGAPIFPAVGYLDDRVKRYIRRLTESEADRITSTMYIPIALFFKEEHPRVYRSTHKFLQSFDYIAYRLTGLFCASTSSSGIRPWDGEKIEKTGLDSDKFPPIVYMGEQIGTTNIDAEMLFGIPRGIPVYAIGVDFAAALVGTNSLSKGRSCERAGSSGGINLCWDKSITDNRLLCYPHLIEGYWNIAGITSTYGKAVDWVKGVIGRGSLSEVDPNRLPGPPILFLPYLKGERTPLWNPDAKALFFGLTSSHGPGDVLRSVYLGIAFSIRDCMEIIEGHGPQFQYPVVTTGGLAKAEWFIQLKADATGVPFAKTQLNDAELLGIAIVLARASGLYSNIPDAARSIVREKRVFEPQQEMLGYYSELFGLYKELQEKMLPNFK